MKEELSAARASIAQKWTKLQGLSQHQAMVKYMSIVKEWPGYGSTLFDVEVRDVFTAKERVGLEKGYSSVYDIA